MLHNECCSILLWNYKKYFKTAIDDMKQKTLVKHFISESETCARQMNAYF